MKHYTLAEIRGYLVKHMPEEYVEDTLNFPYTVFGGKSAMELLNREDDDYSADVMGCFRRVYG